nr:hypothetical protein [Tanacetum cinerariifolium]
MTSITAQQTKLDLKLVPKENRLDIGKCNERIPHGLKPKEETFHVALDALALTPCYHAFFITADVPEVYMHQFWNSVYKHHDFYRFKIDKKKRFELTLEVSRDILQIFPRIKDQDFDALPSKEDIVYFLRELGHIRVVNSLNDVVINQMHQPKEASQKYGVVLLEYLTTPKMKESKDYKTYLGYATGTVPPKVARKFKKASPSKKDSVPVTADEEPVQKGKRVKKSAKKSSTTPTTGIVIKEPLVETQSKRKEKGTGDKPGIPDVTKDDSTESESESWGNDDDDSNDKEGTEQENDNVEHDLDSEQETDRSESDSESDQQDDDGDDEVKDDDEVKENDEVKDDDEDDDNDDDQSGGDEDRGMDSDVVPDKKADVGMTDAQQEKENLEITQEQVVKDAHTSKDAETTTSPKTKDSSSKSSKGNKSQPKSFRKPVHVKEPKFKVGETNTPQGQEGNQGNDNDEPRTESSSRRACTRVESFTTTQKPAKIIPGPAGIVQAVKLLKQTDIQDGGEGCVMSTQEYIKKVFDDEDEDFKSGSWVSAAKYTNANGGIVIMSPSTRKKFRWGTIFLTGRKLYTDPETMLRIKRTNRKCRMPIDLNPCRVEEKLIMREVEGKWIMKKEMRMISKDDTIFEFLGYTSSKEEDDKEKE